MLHIYKRLLLSFLISTSFGVAKPVFKEIPIFPFQDKHVHSSSIVECPNGDVLACWFHGSGERTADDVCIQGSRLRAGSGSWEPVFLLADTPGFPDCNPVLFIDDQERLWLFWITVLAHRWEQSILKYRRTTDYTGGGPPNWQWQDVIVLKPGDSFATAVEQGFDQHVDEGMWAEYAPPYTQMLIEAARNPAKRQTGWMTRTHPLILPSGRFLLPLYSDGFCLGLAAISDDDGATWRASQPMVGLGLNQPSIVRKKDGTLMAFMRDEGVLPMRVLKSISQDDGETWSYAVDTDVPNPSSSVEAIALRDDSWLLIHNDTEEGRFQLAASLSFDEGASWTTKRYIARDDTKKCSYSYPSIIQTRDGLLHLTYSFSDGTAKTIKYSVFNTEWLNDEAE